MQIENLREHHIVSELCKKSLYEFTREFIDIIDPADYFWNWHIEYICDQVLQPLILAYKEDKPTYHLNLNICPGATKSTIFSRIATPWIWTVFPEATVINVSRDSNNIKEFALKSKEIINSEKYKLMFPDVRIKDEPDSMFYFENTMGGRRYGLTTSSKGSTGKHADFIIFDDIYAYNDLESPQTIKTLEKSIEGLLSRFKDKSKGVVMNVMQRLGPNDPTAFLFEGYDETKPKLTDYKNICLPAEITGNVDPPELKENYVDGLLDPIRLNRAILAKEKQKYGYKYEAQFDQNPILDTEGLMFKEINTYSHDTPEGATYSFTDVANKGDDYLCTWFVRVTSDSLYVFDAIYTKEDYTVTIPRLAGKMNLYKCVMNWVESNSFGQMFVTELQKQVASVEGYYESDSKVHRIFGHSHHIGHLKFKEGGSDEYRKAIDHMKRLPKKIPNGGKGMDVDSADAITALIRYFYHNYPHYFMVK